MTTTPLDAAWQELEYDALASDGAIRDSDVIDAIQRNRGKIEALAAQQHLHNPMGCKECQALYDRGFFAGEGNLFDAR